MTDSDRLKTMLDLCFSPATIVLTEDADETLVTLTNAAGRYVAFRVKTEDIGKLPTQSVTKNIEKAITRDWLGTHQTA